MIDLSSIAEYVVKHAPVGSRVTCNPPPKDAYDDHLVLIDAEDVKCVIEYLVDDEWIHDVEDYALAFDASNDFLSFRKGLYNILLTSSPRFYVLFLAATSVAKRLNLIDKEDRIALFQAVLYGNACDDT